MVTTKLPTRIPNAATTDVSKDVIVKTLRKIGLDGRSAEVLGNMIDSAEDLERVSGNSKPHAMRARMIQLEATARKNKTVLKQMMEEHEGLARQHSSIAAALEEIHSIERAHAKYHLSMHAAHCGDIELALSDPSTIMVPRADLDDSEQEWIVRAVRLKMQSLDQNHLWVTDFLPLHITAVDSFSGGQDASTGDTPVYFDQGIALVTWTLGGSGAWPASAKSTGSIPGLAEANLLDGETFTLIGNRTAQAALNTAIFEYRKDGGPATAGNYLIAIEVGDTAAQVAAKTAAVINSIRATDMKLAISATVDGTDVDLEQDVPGDDGDTVIAFTVADVGFVPTDFTGGAADKVELTLRVESAPGEADDKVPFGVAVPPAGGVKLRLVGV